MTGSRMKIAGRFKHCAHMGCFDLEGFVELNQRSRKWQCPICLKNYSSENIIIDPYFNRITSLMRNCGEDVNEIDVKPDGSWRSKNEGDCRDLAQWHLPDGSLCPTTDADVKPDLEILRQIKLEGTSEGHTGLRLGIKRNRDGVWEVSKPECMRPPSSGDHVPERFENNFQKMMPMSGSASGSFRDGEDPSVNQGGGHFDFSINNGLELDCISLDFDPTYDVEDGIPPAPLKDADVIILTDSEDENITMISPETIFDAAPVNGIPFSANHPGVSERFSEDPGLGTSGTSRLGLFSDDFGMPLWPMQTGPQAGPGFQIFGTDAGNRDPVGGYGLASGGGLGDSLEVRDLSTSHSNTEANGSLVDNPLAFGGDDPSLQIFLPSRSAGETLESDLGDRTKLRNGDHPDDWISLTLAAGGGCGDSAPANGLNSRQQLTRKESRMESLADASLLLSMSEDRAKKPTSNSQRFDTAFSHVPRQPRSVRARLYLSIDTDSD